MPKIGCVPFPFGELVLVLTQTLLEKSPIAGYFAAGDTLRSTGPSCTSVRHHGPQPSIFVRSFSAITTVPVKSVDSSEIIR